MERVGLSGETLKALRAMQRNELTESIIYRRIAARVSSPADRQVLERMADEELAHCRRWEEYTGSRPASDRRKVAWYGLLARLLGYTFVLKLMENGERKAQTGYAAIARQLPEAQAVMEDEERHEQHLLQLLDERHLQYVGSVVLGLNDALVELTGTLAGLSFALHDNRLVALAGLVTGIAATLSMASSQFLSARAEGRADALLASLYTGAAYLAAVTVLVLPFLAFPPAQVLAALGTMLLVVVGVIMVFNFYVAVARDLPFRARFLEMVSISLGVALLSFLIGLLARRLLGVEV